MYVNNVFGTSKPGTTKLKGWGRVNTVNSINRTLVLLFPVLPFAGLTEGWHSGSGVVDQIN